MIIRLVLGLVLALTGAGTAAPQSGAAPGLADSIATPAASPAVVPTVTGQPDPDDVVVTEVEVVVPAVDPAGDVVPSTDVARGRADDDVLVADEVVEAAAAPERVLSEVLETEGFQTLGVTWPVEADADTLAPQARTRTSGEWSAWQALDVADETPDPGTADAAGELRGGTDPLWVGQADAVQVSFASQAQAGPADLSLTLVDVPLSEPVSATGAVAQVGAVVTSAAYVTGPVATAVAPAVVTRAQWGARAQSCTPDVARGLVGAAVHHTAGSNAYATQAQAMQQIRGDQAYHMDGRGWCDLGYNFVIDKWGTIYEGRANSLTSPVVGVHAGGFNTGTVGISMLGNYQDVQPPAAMIAAAGQIIGLRLAAYDVDPAGTMSYATGTGENSKFQNQTVVLPRVFAHRDVAYTACPGQYAYPQMNTIRSVASTFREAQRYAEFRSVVAAMYADLLGRSPDPTGHAGWTAALMQGTGQAALVDSLTRSDEYISSRVAKAYREVLGREPEAAGALNWLNAIRAGQATVDDVQRRFYDSPEYYDASGGTDPGYVDRLYTTMTRRPATPAERTAGVAALTERGRAAVVDGLWFSLEAASVRSGDYYQTFLGRAPDAAGQAAWAQVLLSHGEGAVRNGIAGSQEYRARALTRFP